MELIRKSDAGRTLFRRAMPQIGVAEIKTVFHLCHSEGALATEESYSTDLLQAEFFLSETGAVKSFAALRMTD